jgi:hypothetical protein
MKLKLEGDRFVVFQPGAQTAVPSNEWTTYDVAGEGSKLRDNNDSGTTETSRWLSFVPCMAISLSSRLRSPLAAPVAPTTARCGSMT